MKKLFFYLALFTVSTVIEAQEGPVIKQGSRLKYAITVNGNTFPMFMQVETLTKNNCHITWSFEDGRSGKFIMQKSSLDSASSGYWNPPINGEELLLPAMQNVLFLSRSVFSSLQTNKAAVFDEYMVRVEPVTPGNAFKIKDSLLNALYLIGEPGTKIWVLNDSSIPLILKIQGNPYGVDVELVDIN